MSSGKGLQALIIVNNNLSNIPHLSLAHPSLTIMAAETTLNEAKHELERAFENATKFKAEAFDAYNQEREDGVVDVGQTFDNWWPQNASIPKPPLEILWLIQKQYPRYTVARQEYDMSRSKYEAALGRISGDRLGAWQRKIQQAAMDNRRPDGSPDFSILVSPNE